MIRWVGLVKCSVHAGGWIHNRASCGETIHAQASMKRFSMNDCFRIVQGNEIPDKTSKCGWRCRAEAGVTIWTRIGRIKV